MQLSSPLPPPWLSARQPQHHPPAPLRCCLRAIESRVESLAAKALGNRARLVRVFRRTLPRCSVEGGGKPMKESALVPEQEHILLGVQVRWVGMGKWAVRGVPPALGDYPGTGGLGLHAGWPELYLLCGCNNAASHGPCSVGLACTVLTLHGHVCCTAAAPCARLARISDAQHNW